MTLNELHTKWFQRLDDIPCQIVNVSGQPIYTRPGKVHQAPIGDFISAYIEHINLPWWKRKWDWKIVSRLMIDCLNKNISITFYSLD